MREIKFRGRRKDNGEWVHGNLVIDSEDKSTWIIDYANHKLNSYTWFEVDSETVEQYTGLKDKNGKEIYEGDILEINIDEPVTVYYHESLASFCVRGGWLGGDDLSNYWEQAEIIGNIHEVINGTT